MQAVSREVLPREILVRIEAYADNALTDLHAAYMRRWGGTPSAVAIHQWGIRREGNKLIISSESNAPLYVNGFAATASPARPTWAEGGWLRGQVAITVRRRVLDLTEVLSL